MRRAWLNWPAGAFEVVAARLGEVVEPPPVGDPVGRQPRAAAEEPARAGEGEQQVQRPGSSWKPCSRRRRCGSCCGRAGTPRPRTRSASPARRSAPRRPRTSLRPFVNTSSTTARLEDPRQEVVPDHPLVVLDDDLARAWLKRWLAACPAGSVVDDAVVEADERQVGLRDGEVLVVALVGDHAPSASARGRSKPCLAAARRPPRSCPS